MRPNKWDKNRQNIIYCQKSKAIVITKEVEMSIQQTIENRNTINKKKTDG